VILPSRCRSITAVSIAEPVISAAFTWRIVKVPCTPVNSTMTGPLKIPSS
jgi:hypothetical protein